ncbi:ABC transporter ATP-binding protein [Mobilitalea sibirica]|uniref:ABC-type quaternary amine transporter n=1 Tax=Mobilitalea sibirica TaxID=1462919 RepID=A0A8J7H1C0_9FIRM|nr:ABC transporter ATP-binding protein [Mobilitalea sibirica]MBH1942519.1 ABC transporter ATP-binding protein [Mobilitalea sibirica]
MIKIKNIHKTFDDMEILKNINFDVEEGTFLSLIGPSGCGKSTLINIIAGLEKATSGQVTVDDAEVKGTHTDRIMVFQNAALFPWLNVYDNITFGLKNICKNPDEIREKTEDILRKVHLSKFKNYYPYQLSGGMKQRVSIARSLVMNPRILLMDEPFSALDEQTRMLLHDELQQIWMETKKTIIFVTHNIREAVKLSNRVIIMGTRPGRIVDDIKIELSYPRQVADPNLTYMEEKIYKILKVEIEKVAREELGDEYSIKENSLSRDYNNTMGGGI